MDAVAVNPIFVANMTQLWRHDPRLAQRIDEVPLDSGLEVEPSKTGPPTATVRTADGRTIQLHSRYDPLREAADFCKPFGDVESMCFVLCGLGLGHILKALIERLGPGIVVLVSEPDLVTLKTALEHVDLSKELGGGRVEFLTRLDKSELHDRLGRHPTPLVLGTTFVVPPPAREHQADFHAACRQEILDYAAFAKMSLVTLLKNAAITSRNVANNLPTYVATPPADILRRRFAGCPAVLVAAGPSLHKNIDRLRDARDRVIIIAAQTTLRPLLERGIHPHFVTSLDFSDLSRPFFENLDIPDDVVLVAEPKAAWSVIDVFRGPATAERRVILLDNAFAHLCVGPALARTPMTPGATVMHLAFYLAQWLGCEPIIFIGQDLGFSGHCYYAPGVAMHRAWQPELGRFGSIEGKEWERIVRHRQILRKTQDVFGRAIYSDDQMFTYLQQFERDFAACTTPVIDATEGGVRKAGTTIMTLDAALERFAARPLPAERFDYLQRPWHDRSKLAPARSTLAARREELKTLREICEETRAILDELEGLIDRPTEFNRRIVRVDELRTLVQDHQAAYAMVVSVSQLGELQRFYADRRMEGATQPDPVRVRRQLQRDRTLVDALLDGCGQMERIVDEALARFDAAMEATP